MRILKTIDTAISYIFMALIATVGLYLLLDIGMILSDPTEYKNVHDFPESTVSWKSTSVILYTLRNLAFVAILGALFYIGYKKAIHENSSRFNYLYYGIVIFFFMRLFWGYYQWTQTGFDH